MVSCASCDGPLPDTGVLCPSCGAMIDRHAAPLAGVVAPSPDLTPLGARLAVVTPPPAFRACSESGCPFEVLPGQSNCLGGHSVGAPTTDAVIIGFPDGQQVHLSSGDALELGRQSSSPAVRGALVRFDTVSRLHAVIALTGNVLRVTHLSTSNATYVNERPVTGEVLHPLPARVRLGESVTITVTEGRRHD